MKRAYIFIITLFSCLVTFAASGKCGDNARWELNADGILIIKGTGPMNSTGTSDYLYITGGSWCLVKDIEVKHIIIEDGITSINDQAFCQHKKLQSVSLPSSVKSIGKRAFLECDKLISIEFPEGLEFIDADAFWLCKQLRTITFPSTIKKIGVSAFADCTNLKNVIIPENVFEISERCFNGCSNLISASIRDGVHKIRKEAFADCENLTYVSIPASVTQIHSKAFSGCSRLQKIEVAKNNNTYFSNDGILYTIDNTLAIYPAGRLGEYSLPHFVTRIGQYAFASCMGLTSIVIPNGVIEIAEAAFWQCGGLTSVTLPTTIQHIGNCAFCGCNSLQIINVPPKNINRFYEMESLMDYIPIIYADKNLSSEDEVDFNIPLPPQRGRNKENTFVVIIANEHYQNAEDVPFAINDGRIFNEYCRKTLAIPDKHIHYIKDATLNNIIQNVMWLQDIMDVYKGSAQIIFYYSGHGVPDDADKSAFLLPVDGKGNLATTGYKIEQLYADLSKYTAKSVTIFLDACFSGSSREGGMIVQGTKGVAVKAKYGSMKGNLVVFSAAQEDETAYPDNSRSHGLFTYFLLKKLQETAGDVRYEDLGNYLIENVSRESVILYEKRQTPKITSSLSLGDDWKDWNFINSK